MATFYTIKTGDADWVFYTLYPARTFAVDGHGVLWVAYTDCPEVGKGNIYLAYSSDKGVTWTETQLTNNIDKDTSGDDDTPWDVERGSGSPGIGGCQVGGVLCAYLVTLDAPYYNRIAYRYEAGARHILDSTTYMYARPPCVGGGFIASVLPVTFDPNRIRVYRNFGAGTDFEGDNPTGITESALRTVMLWCIDGFDADITYERYEGAWVSRAFPSGWNTHTMMHGKTNGDVMAAGRDANNKPAVCLFSHSTHSWGDSETVHTAEVMVQSKLHYIDDCDGIEYVIWHGNNDKIYYKKRSPGESWGAIQTFYENDEGWTHLRLADAVRAPSGGGIYLTLYHDYALEFCLLEGTPGQEWGTPEVTTEAATAIAAENGTYTATIHGTVVKSNSEPHGCKVLFQYGKSTDSGDLTWSDTLAGWKHTDDSFELVLTGLDADTLYMFRAVGRSNRMWDYSTLEGLGFGMWLYFKTSEPAGTDTPEVTTDAASAIGIDTATLNGTLVEDNGDGALCWFFWGDPAFIHFTHAVGAAVGYVGQFCTPCVNKVTGQSWDNVLTGLLPATKYAYFSCAQNSHSLGIGDVVEFSTKDPQDPAAEGALGVVGSLQHEWRPGHYELRIGLGGFGKAEITIAAAGDEEDIDEEPDLQSPEAVEDAAPTDPLGWIVTPPFPPWMKGVTPIAITPTPTPTPMPVPTPISPSSESAAERTVDWVRRYVSHTKRGAGSPMGEERGRTFYSKHRYKRHYRGFGITIGQTVWGQLQNLFHNTLKGLQGGAAGEYYHLTAAQIAALHATYTNAEAITAAKTIKLDDFAAPDDNTDLDASTSKHGLLKKLDDDDTHFLDGKGAWATPSGGGSFDIFDKFREFITWTCLDAFTLGGDAGYIITAQGPSVQLVTANADDDDAWLHSTAYWYDLLVAGKTTTVEMPIVTIDAKDGNTWIRMAMDMDDPPSEIREHFGWKTINADLYASNGSGAAQTITDTGINLSFGSRKALKVVVIPGTSAKFYVRNVLKATHTTNLPSVGHYYIHLHARNMLAASTQAMRVARILIESEY